MLLFAAWKDANCNCNGNCKSWLGEFVHSHSCGETA
jgi:hypothetical protein